MNHMNVKISGWNDGFDHIRKKIIEDVMDIMYMFFRNDGLYESDLIVSNIASVDCPFGVNLFTN